MIVNCKNILTLPYANQLVMVAGEGGKNNVISDVHVVEEMALLEFVAEGELILSMGCSMKTDIDKWLEFAEDTYERGASGLVICLGMYLHTTPLELISLCDELEYPLFELRREIRISNVIHNIYRAMFREEYSKHEIANFFSDIVDEQVSCSPSRIRRAATFSFDNTRTYELLVARVTRYDYTLVDVKKNNETVCEYDYLDRFYSILQEYIGNKHDGAIIFRRDPNIVIMIPKLSDNISSIAEDLHTYLDENSTSAAIAAGVQFQGLANLPRAFKKLERLIKNQDFTSSKIFYYDDLKFKTILYEIENEKLLMDLVDRNIGDILVSDKADILYPSIKAYVDCECNMEKAAERLYIHQNTLRYRLDKIEAITGKSLKNFSNLYDIKMAIEIYEHIGPNRNQ